jgi:glycosyltransferase involved in cell wall biosynthesis
MNQISVVVCTRNEEQMIEKCLQSLVSQMVRPEIIVVDGNSIDRTRQIAQQYADKILLDHGGGISEARNIGWRAATFPIVAFCDADCLPHREWTRNLLNLMEPDVIGVSGPLSAYDGSLTTRFNIRIWADWFPRFLAWFGYHSIWGANMGFPKRILEKYSFRLRFLEDYDLGMRLRRSGEGRLRFHESISMPMSSRRFKEGFYQTVLQFYVKTVILMKVFHRYNYSGYYLPPAQKTEGPGLSAHRE